MFAASQALFMYCISPVHMGAGTAIGLIDNPIQRERHTDHPMFAGAGLKGAVRHHFWAQLDEQTRKNEQNLLNRLFGPATNASEYAGAISFSDAQLVAFPVRSVKRGFVYATSPLALARTQRSLELADLTTGWTLPEIPQPEQCRVVDEGLLAGDKLALEAFEFTAQSDKNLEKIAAWLAKYALPAQTGYTFFRNKLERDLVLLTDADFGYFVRNATVVEPHVRINDESGTADDGGLFYTENLPPESLLLTIVMASVERYSKNHKPEDWWNSAENVRKAIVQGKGEDTPFDQVPFKGLQGQLLQIGGDATTGRGQVIIQAVEHTNQAKGSKTNG